VARLFAKGTDAILKKVGEEATETVMAAKDGDRPRSSTKWPTCGSTRWWRWRASG
jgi:phosphoribosyl-ATP pyrophosphohydrolase